MLWNLYTDHTSLQKPPRKCFVINKNKTLMLKGMQPPSASICHSKVESSWLYSFCQCCWMRWLGLALPTYTSPWYSWRELPNNSYQSYSMIDPYYIVDLDVLIVERYGYLFLVDFLHNKTNHLIGILSYSLLAGQCASIGQFSYFARLQGFFFISYFMLHTH